MRVLITGAGGFIGSHLVDACVKAGDLVHAIDRKPVNKWIKGEKEADFSWSYKIQGKFPSDNYVPDVIYHLAAESRIDRGNRLGIEEYTESNIIGLINVLDLAWKTKAKLIFASSCTAAEPNRNWYAATKRQGELICQRYYKAHNVQVAIARIYNVYGPREYEEGPKATVMGIFKRQYLDGVPFIITGTGAQARDFIHVYDVISTLRQMALKKSASDWIYEIGTGEAISIASLAKMFDHPCYNQYEADWISKEMNISSASYPCETTIHLRDYVESIKKKKLASV